MQRRVYFITHPNVVIDPAVPITDWPLSGQGLSRMAAGLRQPWIGELTAIYSSAERKARDGAGVLASHRALPYQVVAALGENDRSSTGYLPPAEFERVADQFFAEPRQSVRGWETAEHAQQRIVQAVDALVTQDRSPGSIAIVAHGAVGTLLYCHLAGEPISRMRDQPSNGGGNYFSFPVDARAPDCWWQPFDQPAA